MFRLIKLGLFGLVAYSLYECVRGFLNILPEVQRQGEAELPGGRPRGAVAEAMEQDEMRMGTLTGPSHRGVREVTDEPSGTSTPHIVGRGVTGQ